MTAKEFSEQITRLKKAFSDNQFPDERVQTIFSSVKDLEVSWLSKHVTKMIMAMNPRYDLGEAATHERRAQNSVRFASDVSSAVDAFDWSESQQGLQKALDGLGAKNLLEAIHNASIQRKQKKQEWWDK